MTLAIIAAVLISLATGLAFARIFRHLAAPVRPPAFAGDWAEQLSLEKYRPMERLLDEADFRFLAAQPGYHARMGRQLRAERRRVLRGYMRSLERDFGRICGAIHALMAASEQDRPDLAAMLVQRRVSFAWGILSLRVRLVLDAAGWRGVDVRPLLNSLEGLRGELRQLALAPAPSAA